MAGGRRRVLLWLALACAQVSHISIARRWLLVCIALCSATPYRFSLSHVEAFCELSEERDSREAGMRQRCLLRAFL